MVIQENVLTNGVERLNALIAWWGFPAAGGDGAIDHQMKRLQQFASDMQKIYGDAYKDELDTLAGSNDRLGRSFQDLLQSRRPPELLAAESEILATLLEGASQRARRWSELTQKIQECCAGMARDAAADFRERAQGAASAKVNGAAEQIPAKPQRRQGVQA